MSALPPLRPLPPLRALPRGPKFHWFGYYDKEQFAPTGREDVLTVGMDIRDLLAQSDCVF